MNQKDINHLEWVYERMQFVHNENPNLDYMKRFREIIETCKDGSRCNHDFTKSASFKGMLICNKCRTYKPEGA